MTSVIKTKGMCLGEKLFSQVLNMPAYGLEQTHGSFLVANWGKSQVMKLKNSGETYIRAEWHLWIYMCFWEILKDGAVIAHCESSNECIAAVLQQIEGKPLTYAEIINDQFDLLLEFYLGDGELIYLRTYANNNEDDNEQWMLFTPDHQCFTAGPGTSYEYGPSGSQP